jgi:hypothetical protein
LAEQRFACLGILGGDQDRLGELGGDGGGADLLVAVRQRGHAIGVEEWLWGVGTRAYE